MFVLFSFYTHIMLIVTVITVCIFSNECLKKVSKCVPLCCCTYYTVCVYGEIGGMDVINLNSMIWNNIIWKTVRLFIINNNSKKLIKIQNVYTFYLKIPVFP